MRCLGFQRYQTVFREIFLDNFDFVLLVVGRNGLLFVLSSLGLSLVVGSSCSVLVSLKTVGGLMVKSNESRLWIGDDPKSKILLARVGERLAGIGELLAGGGELLS
jgi:hypothetical protein